MVVWLSSMQNGLWRLNELYQSLKDDTSFAFISISYDENEKLPEIIRQFHLSYPVAFLNLDQMYKYNFGWGVSLQHSDKRGKIAMFLSGGAVDEATEEKEIREILMPKIKWLLKKEK